MRVNELIQELKQLPENAWITVTLPMAGGAYTLDYNIEGKPWKWSEYSVRIQIGHTQADLAKANNPSGE